MPQCKVRGILHSDRESLLTGTPWKSILIFSIPVMISYLLQIMYGTLDTIIIGQTLGESSLSAAGVSVTLTTVFGCVAWGFSSGMNAVLARYGGADKDDVVKECSGTGIAINLIVGAVVMVLCMVLCRPIYVYVMGVPDDILDMAVDYTMVFSLGFIFQFGYNAVAAVMRSLGDSISIMYVLLTTIVIDVVLDLVLICVFDMGVKGAALATAICQIISLVMIIVIFNRKNPAFRYTFGSLKINGAYTREIMTASIPMVVQQMVIFGSAIFFQQMANSFGESMIASFAVERRLETIYRLPIAALGAGTLTFVGLHYGSKQYERMFLGIRQIVMMSVIVTLVISFLSFIFAEQLAMLFNINGQALDYCVEHIRTINILFPIFALYFPILAVFQAVKRPRLSLGITMLELFTRIVCLYALVGVFDYGIIWWNALFGWGICLIVTYWFYKKGDWRKDIGSDMSVSNHVSLT